MTAGRPASGPRERAARRARTACSLAERIDGAEEWLHVSHGEQPQVGSVRAFYARLVASGAWPDFPPDALP
ncbi:MAG TPA: hypothetical protein PLL32_06460, partial [Anaeromyxobacteraceae bacterium]|nr:hypothetical protein [Anaeromyxobacteraceae bacterium]